MNVPAVQQNSNAVLFDPGRVVQGDLYEPQDKDQQGAPLTIKTGPNAGKTRVNHYFAVAIPKTQPNWWLERWGAQVLALANAAWPQGQCQNPKFSWKIEDGDSQTPNENGRKNADREGHPGCWIVKFGSMYPVKILDSSGNPMLQPGLVKRGFWVEVFGTVEGNNNATKPGIYVNHSFVAFRAPDKEIQTGPDPRSIGFGRAPLPPGVTAAPVGTANMPAMPPQTPAAGPGPGTHVYPAPPAATPGVPPGAAPAAAAPPTMAPTPVQPNPSFIAPPVAGAHPSVPPAAGAPPPSSQPAAAYPDPLGAPAGYRMANAAGARYESFRQQAWSDAAMIQAGHMVRL